MALRYAFVSRDLGTFPGAALHLSPTPHRPYLVIQITDVSKPLVALGWTWFAVQTGRLHLTGDHALT